MMREVVGSRIIEMAKRRANDPKELADGAGSGSLVQPIVSTPDKRAKTSSLLSCAPTTSYRRRCRPSTENYPRLTECHPDCKAFAEIGRPPATRCVSADPIRSPE
jgi:hypothetical protein